MLALRIALAPWPERLEHVGTAGKFACPLAASGADWQAAIMNSNGDTLRLAVLIDGENVPARDAGPLFAQVAKLGNPIIRRVYGDFTKGNVKDWPKVISKHGGSPSQTGHTSSGKNASDIALVVDAMDFLHKRSVDGFCIVTGDGDFTSLAKRAREDGFKVYCFAHSNAAKSLKAACDGFFSLHAATPQPQAKATPVAPNQKAGQPGTVFHPHKALPWILEVWPENKEWVTIKALEKALTTKQPNFLSETNYETTKKLFKALKDRLEPGLASDGRNDQVRRRP
jgi:hypothetical protein